MDDMNDLISVPEAARRAGVARNTMFLAARNGTIKALKLGRDWHIYASDLDRWRREVYRPNKAHRHPVKNDREEDTENRT